MRKTALLMLAALIVCGPAQANYHPSTGGTNTDVIVDMPREAWTQGQNNQQNWLYAVLYFRKPQLYRGRSREIRRRPVTVRA